MKISIALRALLQAVALVVPRAAGSEGVPESEETKL